MPICGLAIAAASDWDETSVDMAELEDDTNNRQDAWSGGGRRAAGDVL